MFSVKNRQPPILSDFAEMFDMANILIQGALKVLNLTSPQNIERLS
jgi:hypothetical protein